MLSRMSDNPRLCAFSSFTYNDLPKNPFILAQNPRRNGTSKIVLFACPQFTVALAHKDLLFEEGA
jgi:hypothetical protein